MKQTAQHRLTRNGLLLFLIAFSLILHASGQLAWGQESVSTPALGEQNLLCGPHSLVSAAARLGVWVDINECINRCTRTQDGVSFLSLKIAAESLGLKTEGVRLTWTQLTELKTPAILFLGGNHFALVDPREQGEGAEAQALRLYDYPKTARWVKSEELAETWHGEALILEKQDQPQPQPSSALQFDTLLEDFGPVYTQEQVEHEFHFRNVSAATISILRVVTTCGCTSAKVDKTELAPNETGTLKVVLDLKGRKGVQRQTIGLLTSDPGLPELTLVYQGMVVNPVHVSTDMIDLGDVIPGTQDTRRVVLTDRGSGSLKLLGYSAAITPLTATEPAAKVLASWTPTATPYEELNAGPEQGVESIALIRGGRSDLHYLVKVGITIPEASQPGLHTGRLSLVTNDPHYPTIEIPIAYNVTSPLLADHTRLTFGLVKPGQLVSRRITIQRRDGGAIGPLSIDIKANGTQLEPHPIVEAKQPNGKLAEVVVTLNIKPDNSESRPGLHQGELHIQTADRQSITIPWLYYIKKG